jgi:uncharacterized protein
MRKLLILLVVLGSVFKAHGQLYNRMTYHDLEKRHIKEFYQVKDTIKNILHGRYISFFLNGHPESKGQFLNNETNGEWEFFYETGNLKMRGILKQNSNYGLWEYFYESGQKSMEGTINGKNREGEWKLYYENGQLKEIGTYEHNKHIGLWKDYYEDGALKGEIDYVDDFGRYIEYYHSGNVFGEGPRMGHKNNGHWRYYAEDGSLSMEGEFISGKRQGEWTHFFPSGKMHSQGHYDGDHPIGEWDYYYEAGEIHKKGNYVNGKKDGAWDTYSQQGKIQSEALLAAGSGTFKEYHDNGQVKSTGNLKDEKREGKWEFFFDNGKKEADCEYENGRGTYYGYYTDGALQTKGPMEEDRKVGTWEIYERDGTLAGYYKPFYDEKTPSIKDISKLADRKYVRTNASRTKGLSYFDARISEFKGIIVAGNPLFTAIGRLPLAAEFYIHERLGHEVEFIFFRDPFFTKDKAVAIDKHYLRGYSICLKQKLYNPLEVGMWYFGHELRFTDLSHFVNLRPNAPLTVDGLITASAAEQLIGYGPLLGYRFMRKGNKTKGLTADVFGSFNIGYRKFADDALNPNLFDNLTKNQLLTSFHVGLNVGNVFGIK